MYSQDIFDNSYDENKIKYMDYPTIDNISSEYTDTNANINIFPSNKLLISKIEQFNIISRSFPTSHANTNNNFIKEIKIDSNECLKKKRGKKSLNQKEQKHSRLDPCNIRKKLIISYFSFIIQFVNCIIELIFYDDDNIEQYKLKKIVHPQKINIQFINELRNKTIKEIISEEISKKYYYGENNENEIKCNIIEEKSEVLKIILNKKFMDFFDIFYKSSKKVNLKNYGIQIPLFLNSNVDLYKDFKNKIINGGGDDLEKYLLRIEECMEKLLKNL